MLLDIRDVSKFKPTAIRPSLQRVKQVISDSPADKAGVRVGDFILKVGADLEIPDPKMEEDGKLGDHWEHCVLIVLDENIC